MCVVIAGRHGGLAVSGASKLRFVQAPSTENSALSLRCRLVGMPDCCSLPGQSRNVEASLAVAASAPLVLAFAPLSSTTHREAFINNLVVPTQPYISH